MQTFINNSIIPSVNTTLEFWDYDKRNRRK
jgi:hypothetical protein